MAALNCIKHSSNNFIVLLSIVLMLQVATKLINCHINYPNFHNLLTYHT